MRPPDARWLLVLAHGAGAGMDSDFMEITARELSAVRIATFRYQFPYMEHGKKSPDPPPVLQATVLAALEAAQKAAADLPLIAGGKSLGGRMTSMASLPAAVRGLVFFGFPLHAPGKPSAGRADHLSGVTVPMLFLQGTRDTLADLSLLEPVCDRLGDRATLHIVEGADHSFHVPKSAGLTDEEVIRRIAGTVADWASQIAV
jgi:predicted alpha/beta-hydrolase family hydrolase